MSNHTHTYTHTRAHAHTYTRTSSYLPLSNDLTWCIAFYVAL